MAKKESYTLKAGRQQPFRRTIDLGTEEKPKPVTMVFEPGEFYQLSKKEVTLLAHEIEVGMLESVNLDSRGHHRPPTQQAVEAEETIQALEATVEEQAAYLRELEEKLIAAGLQIEELTAEIEELTTEIEELTTEPEDDESTEDEQTENTQSE